MKFWKYNFNMSADCRNFLEMVLTNAVMEGETERHANAGEWWGVPETILFLVPKKEYCSLNDVVYRESANDISEAPDQNWLPRTQRPFPLNSWWKNGPFWCKNHCSSSKTVDFSIFSGGARKKVGPLGGPLSDMTPNTLVYHFSYIFRKSQWVWGVLAPK